MTRLLPLLLIPLLSSCVGYQLGGVKPKSLARIHQIAVPMFKNSTQHPRAEAVATSAVASQLLQDGTYRIASTGNADAILEGTIHRIQYTQLRATRLDTLRPEELQNTVTLVWVLKDARDPSRILASGTSTGSSRFFVDGNLQTSRNNALPDAMERAGEALVSALANGF